MHEGITKKIEQTRENLQTIKEKKHPFSALQISETFKMARELMGKAYFDEETSEKEANAIKYMIVEKA